MFLQMSQTIKYSYHTAIGQSYNASNANRILDESFDTLNYIAEGVPFFRVFKTAVEFLDKRITEIKNMSVENEPCHRYFFEEMKKRNSNIFPEVIKEFLPELFAKDVSLWLQETDMYLIIFFDTYEQLTDDEKDLKCHKKLIYKGIDVPVDWWIEELLLNTKRVLWVIAGRGEINQIGENFKINKDNPLESENHLFKLGSLEDNFVYEFLNASGITETSLCTGIKELAGGYPLYLNICAETYRKITENGNSPSLENFGEQCDSVISRLLDYMDEKAA